MCATRGLRSTYNGMKSHTKLTKAATDRAVQLRRSGMSGQLIARTLRNEGLASVSRATVDRALAAEGLVASRGRPRRTKAAPTTTGAATPATAPALPAAEPWDHVATRLEEVRALIVGAHRDKNIAAYRDLVRLEAELLGQIAAMRPPPAPDPETDPMYTRARDQLLEAVDRLVQAHEDETTNTKGIDT